MHPLKKKQSILLGVRTLNPTNGGIIFMLKNRQFSMHSSPQSLAGEDLNNVW